MNDNYLGLLISKLRNENGATVEALCEGVCTQSYLSRIEAGERTVGKLMLDCLLGRLGISVDGYESYLSKTEYHRWKKRCEILSLVEQRKIEDAKIKLDLFKNDVGNNRLYNQFALQVEAAIKIIEGKDCKIICEILDKAISITIPRKGQVPISQLRLSNNEIFLLIEYAIQKGKVEGEEEAQKIYEELLVYIEKNEIEELTKAKFYPKIFLLASENWQTKKDYIKIISTSNKVIACLQNSAKLYFISNVLEVKRKAFEGLFEVWDKNNETEKKESCKKIYEEAVSWGNMIKSLFAEYDAENEPFCWYTYYDSREMYPIAQVIKRRRQMLGKSQQDLSSEDCSVITLSRMENNKTSAHPSIIRKILKELNLSDELQNSMIISYDYEVHKLQEQLDDLTIYGRYDEAEIIIEKLRDKLDLSISFNRQYLEYKQTMIGEKTGKLELEQVLENYKQALFITLPFEAVFKNCEKYFTKKEIVIINNIAITLEKLGRREEALSWFQMAKSQYDNIDADISNYIITYELIMTNLSSLLGNMGRYEESSKIAKETIYQCLKCRRGLFITDLLLAIPWNLKTSIEKRRKLQPHEINDYVSQLKKIYVMSCIMKDKILQDYIKNNLVMF